MMVETKKDVIYPLVYLLVKLVLTFPVATATIERIFISNEICKQSTTQSNERSVDE